MSRVAEANIKPRRLVHHFVKRFEGKIQTPFLPEKTVNLLQLPLVADGSIICVLEMVSHDAGAIPDSARFISS